MPRLARALSGLFLSLLLTPGLLLAQAYAPGAAKQHPAVSPQDERSESLLIGSGDLLHITVFRESDLEQKVRVKDSGEIALQLIGNIAVRGLAPTEAADRIAARYKAPGSGRAHQFPQPARRSLRGRRADPAGRSAHHDPAAGPASVHDLFIERR